MAAAKPQAVPKTDAPAPGKSKKMLIIIVAAVALLGGGGGTYFYMKQGHNQPKNEAAKEATPEAPPKYIPLGTFTANLIREESDRYLQVAISIKITNPELEEKIKSSNPEILHHVNMLLQSKGPTELSTFEGKRKLAEDIKILIERVLGFNTPAPAAHPAQPASSPMALEPRKVNTGVDEVLFTSFIIQ
jgi:flagellar FliL protein